MSVESQVSDVMTSAQFSQESIPTLVKGVEAQVAGSIPYNFTANKALLKLYSSVLYKPSFLPYLKSLLLLSLPSSTEFDSLKHILPADALEPCKDVLECGRLLEDCAFEEFWKQAKVADVMEVKGLEDSIRTRILTDVSLGYSTLPTSTLLTYLSLSPNSPLTFDSIECVEGSSVVFKKTDYNGVKKGTKESGIELNRIVAMMN
ncbi:hypothetical protein TrVE_jg1929 [Triparma verrucosa]|uniref:CSN8/PSMD8/EIF3K domain-containing protein n=1 Tax=Triparma verrucosa TaxID=1606542 RepID=A0A9W7BBQ5_9STRA|nr:hypothetical protein TrVE_jg1929 [Triparma verrucosa]